MKNQQSTGTGTGARGAKIIAAVIGTIQIAGMCALLIWNETSPNPANAAKEAVELTPANAAGLENQAVWVKGALTGTPVEPDKLLAEGAYRNFIVLERTAERYIWFEQKRKSKQTVGPVTEKNYTYEYKLRWSSAVPRFEGNNPPSIPPENPDYAAYIIASGDLSIAGHDLIGSALSFTGAQTQLAPSSAALADGLFSDKKYIYESRRAATAPVLGDYRIRYSYIENNTGGIVLGSLRNNRVVRHDFQSAGVINSGASIYRFFKADTIAGVVNLLNREHWSSALGVRLASLFFMLMGFSLLFNPVKALAGILPFVRKVTIASTLAVSAALAITLFLTIMIACTFLNSLSILLAALTLFAGLFIFGALLGRKKMRNGQ